MHLNDHADFNTEMAPPLLDAAVVLERLCNAGVPAALRALLHERSALLPLTADNMKALPVVIDLAHRLVKHERTRRALLADTPDSGSLLLVMCAVARHHPHAEMSTTQMLGNASNEALKLYRAVEVLLDDRDISAVQAFESLMTRLDAMDDPSEPEPTVLAAAKILATRLGWPSASGGGAPPTESPDAQGLRTFFDLNAASSCAGCSLRQRAGRKALGKCGRCQATHYCSRECQVAHWKTHKSTCVAVRDKS